MGVGARESTAAEGVCNEPGHYDPVRDKPRWEGVLDIAQRQHWAISVAQLVEIGFAPDSVRTLVRRGRLHAIHRGVYSVGRPSLSREGR